jgi:hypothetical protein
MTANREIKMPLIAVIIQSFPISFSSEPETDQQNQDKRRQNEPRDHNDLDSQFAHGRYVVVDARIAVKESVTVAKDVRAT